MKFRAVPMLGLLGVTSPCLQAQAPAEIYANLCLLVTRDSGLASPSSPNREDTRNAFELSLRTSQVGVRWDPAPLEDWQVSSRLEFDLQGGAPNTLQPRVRHAFFQFSRGAWELLIGQTWDVIAPLRADSIDFPTESWPGDIGLRRPLIRGSWRMESGPRSSVTFLLAGAQFTQGLEDPASGQVVETSHVPALMGRITADFPIAGEMAQVSLWGHQGSKGYSAHGNLPAGTFQTSSLGTSLRVPMGPRWIFTTELWQGRLGDAAYDPELSRGTLSMTEVVESRGGWCQLAFKPVPGWRFNLGMGRQFPRSLTASEQSAQRISSRYANAFRTLTKRFEVGLEFSDWDSSWPGSAKSNKTFRGQLSLRAMF